ncbi:hypothetical protein D3C81_1917330 [compost metagenome]
MIFSIEVDKSVRITGRTTNWRIVVLRTIFFIIITAGIRHIGILEVSRSLFNDDSCISIGIGFIC